MTEYCPYGEVMEYCRDHGVPKTAADVVLMLMSIPSSPLEAFTAVEHVMHENTGEYICACGAHIWPRRELLVKHYKEAHDIDIENELVKAILFQVGRTSL